MEKDKDIDCPYLSKKRAGDEGGYFCSLTGRLCEMEYTGECEELELINKEKEDERQR